MHEDIILQKYISRIVTTHCQVVSFGLLCICPLVGKFVCLEGTASIFCSAPVKLLPFLLIFRMKQGSIKLHGLKQSIFDKLLVF